MTPDPNDRHNPFLGLRPFEEEDEDLFFGREAQIDELVGRLRRRRFIAVVGTSGSGKSSLVRAGLLPTLHGGFMAGRGSHWFIATMRPGTSPVANLLTALERSGALGDAGEDDAVRHGLARAALDRGALGLVELLRDFGLQPGDNALIVVDQFEELFRYTQADPDAAAAFVKLLMEAAAFEELPIYVVLTMRSDFLGDCARFAGLPETINDGLYLVPRMGWDQLRRAIEGPISVAGAEIEPALVTRLLNDLGDNSEALPVLQHALMRTWDLRADRSVRPTLTIADYGRTGGLAEALSKRGDAVLGGLDPPKKKVAERLFKSVTELGSDNRGIRRPTQFSALAAIVEAPPEQLREVIEVFRAPGTSFLTPLAGAIDGPTVIDIAHESLMRLWDTLKRWVDEEAESALQYRRLAADAAAHAVGNAALWRDPDLLNAERWRAQQQPNAAWAGHVDATHRYDVAMSFLDASIRERSRGDAERRRRRRTLVSILATAVVVLLAITAWAVEQRRAALELQSRLLTREVALSETVARLNEEKRREGAELRIISVERNRANHQADVARVQRTEADRQRSVALAEKRAADSARSSALDQRNVARLAQIRAVDAAGEALQQRTAAESRRRAALVSESQFLARDAQGFVSRGDAVTGMLLALQALPRRINRVGRPVVRAAEYALEDAFANQREQIDFAGTLTRFFQPLSRRMVVGS